MNRVVHFEIYASDPAAAAKFYSEVLGWEIGPDLGEAYGHYRVIMTAPDKTDLNAHPGINGGLALRNAPKPPEGTSANSFVSIVGVDDVDAIMQKAKAAGGIVALDAMDVPKVGRLAYLKDPDGNLFGILKPDMEQA